MSETRYQIRGVITEEETGRVIPGLIVRAFDKDLVFDDKLGGATTDRDGRFQIFFGEVDFKDALESKPDLYLRVFDPTGQKVILETTDAIRWNASPKEFYALKISAQRLQSA